MKSNQFQLSLLEKRLPQEIHLNNEYGSASQATVSSDHCYLATSHQNRESEIKIWDLKTRQTIKNHKISRYSTRLEVFEFTQNCEEFYVMESCFYLLTIIHLKQDIKREIDLQDRCQGFKLSKDQNLGCQYISEQHTLKVWDLKKEQIINTFEFEIETFIADCKFLSNQLILTLQVCEDKYKLFSIWDIKNNRRAKQRKDVYVNGYAKMYVDGDVAIIHYSADEMSFIEVWNLITFSIIRKIYSQLYGMVDLHFFGAQVIGNFVENLMIEDNFGFGNKYNYIEQDENDQEGEDLNEDDEDEGDQDDENEENQNNQHVNGQHINNQHEDDQSEDEQSEDEQIEDSQIEDHDNNQVENQENLNDDDPNEVSQNDIVSDKSSKIQQNQNKEESDDESEQKQSSEEQSNFQKQNRHKMEEEFPRQQKNNIQEIEVNEYEPKQRQNGIEEEDSRNQNNGNEQSQDYLKLQSFNVLTFKEKNINSEFLKSSDQVCFFSSGYIYQKENSNILICVFF